ncbi:UDP-N-acetylmuramoyl-L-alanine--D-glutamate ligase [Selenomonadales bacterium OttesenSCG-928-I06]|nr:UDP-N-acetylmuramoyl-L-alanine--D-glutamate ligase [Selenomonadales bacterium OttesenSCG-928-I06]
MKKDYFKNKNILILGAGISGISAAEVLSAQGANVTLSDTKEKKDLKSPIHILDTTSVNLSLGRQDENLLEKIDYLVLSPGISINIPLVKKAIEKNIPVISEIEAAYRLCEAKIIAVTGTNGKTTTTTLLGEMVKTTNKKVAVGGNIGIALSKEVIDIPQDGLVVAEISSYQLEGVSTFKPYISLILNITPDHIERHGSLENYQKTKERIFENQTDSDYIILNYDDEKTCEMKDRVKGKLIYFSRKENLENMNSIFVKDGKITISLDKTKTDICHIDDIKIRGNHNLENALAASVAAFLAGVTKENISCILKTFEGVEHRIEPTATINGVSYFNDSKATNPESTIKALESFPKNIILIAGGKDKNTDLDEFLNLVKERVDELILLGEAKERFYNEATKHNIKNIHQVTTFKEAVELAHKLAKEPQVVLLSPACASFDMFDNYEQRGEEFKKLVRSLA